MRKINSIWYGSKILLTILLFVLFIPALLYLISEITVKSSIICFMEITSICIGTILLAFFSIMLVIELRQDSQANVRYQEIRKHKIEITPGLFECQNCGNRKLLKKDSICPLCGIKFIDTD